MTRQTFLFWAAICASFQVCAQSLSQPPGSSERIVYFSGIVKVEGGSAPSDPVLIQRVCGGRTRDEALTDAQGRFGFRIEAGQPDRITADATQAPAAAPGLNQPLGNSSQLSMPITSELRDCELQAVLSGFLSDRVSMALKGTLTNVNVGTILIHPNVHVSTTPIVSAATLAVPAGARRAYEKGLAATQRRQWDTASNQFTKAIRAYPDFAAAWFELGIVRQSSGNPARAVAAWKEAVKIDPKFVPPYQRLAAIADLKEDWAESKEYSSTWMQLDPENPAAYLFNAVANARLNAVPEAERAARTGLRIDTGHRVPRLSYVLGLILLQKQEYAESARCFRAYLDLAPQANDAAVVRRQLTLLEESAVNSASR